MEFLILNRKQIETVNPEIPYIVIGVTEPHKSKPVVAKNKWYISDLRLYFSDIIKEEESRYPKGYLFSDQHAQILINFFLRYRSKAELCICQCDGGVSRSAAMAAFLMELIKKDSMNILLHPKYVANTHVFFTLVNIWLINPHYKQLDHSDSSLKFNSFDWKVLDFKIVDYIDLIQPRNYSKEDLENVNYMFEELSKISSNYTITFNHGD